ncbi:MAG: DUF5060 domain-containing protein [Planctomycetaceae bacterium]|nr:DUF5060 domain-containing protein [Planctomycetaceae bacterium]
MRQALPFLLLLFVTSFPQAIGQQPIVGSDTVFAEKNGLIAVEAEHFFDQSKSDVRAFYLTHKDQTPDVTPDGDPAHVGGASGGAYLEILPDTRRTHDDKLIRGVNFMPEPGKMAVVSYKVNIQTPGKYYVWVRAHSTGSEDNGLHVGIDGTWPESGQRLQWCQGKKTWRWDSRQRTEKVHCGEPHKIFLQIDQPGEHTIHFSMREDGFEFDKWLMTTNRDFAPPEGHGPAPIASSGSLPKSFPLVKAPAPAPAEPLNPQPDAISQAATATMPAALFAKSKTTGFYLDKGKWLAVNPDQNKQGSASRTFPYPTGVYNVTLMAVGENDGQSTYTVQIDEETLGNFRCPLSKEMFEVGSRYHKTFAGVQITEGAIVGVTAAIGSSDGQEYSRARWAGVAFEPANAATRKALAPVLKKMAATTTKEPQRDRSTSPTTPSAKEPLQTPRSAHGDGTITVSGESKRWHKMTLSMAGPWAHEKDNQPNPFTDYRMTVTFRHADGTTLAIPGYFAADGDAGNSSAESGNVWKAHFAPALTGKWDYTVSFRQGPKVAVNLDMAGKAVAPFDGKTGTLMVASSDKSGRDLRAHGRLQYTGKRYLQFAGTGQYFLKVGADAPETLLAYADFDNTIAGNPKKAPIKTWAPHLQDWNDGDPTWGDGRGKALIGAVNYLSGKGCNAFSFLTYNAGGDGDNVWPFIQREDKLHYDCSKLDQWGLVFDHGTAKGMYLHFKMQETENDDHNKGKGGNFVPECLDGGNLGVQRKLYCRELIARFGHNLALNWNLGEENTQTNQQQQAMINYIAAVDAYDNHIVIHTYPGEQDKVYRPLLGENSKLTGVSLQNSSLRTTHEQTVKWVQASEAAGRPWVVAFDESGSAKHAQCPDLGYNGFDGRDRSGKMAHTQHEVRQQTLWGTLMGGGAGNEYYFGYQFDQNDIVCEDWRSRDQSWDYCRIAISFFHDHKVPFWEMSNADQLVGNQAHAAGRFCLAKANDTYVVYLPEGGNAELDLSDAKGAFEVLWFNPRSGGDLVTGRVGTVQGSGRVKLGMPPADAGDDWVVLIRRSTVTASVGQWETIETIGKPTARHEAALVASKKNST